MVPEAYQPKPISNNSPIASDKTKAGYNESLVTVFSLFVQLATLVAKTLVSMSVASVFRMALWIGVLAFSVVMYHTTPTFVEQTNSVIKNVSTATSTSVSTAVQVMATSTIMSKMAPFVGSVFGSTTVTTTLPAMHWYQSKLFDIVPHVGPGASQTLSQYILEITPKLGVAVVAKWVSDFAVKGFSGGVAFPG